MRSILGLSLLLALLLFLIGPEHHPEGHRAGGDRGCEVLELTGEAVCLDQGRLLVSARGLRGDVLSAGSAAFHVPGEEAPALVVRVENTAVSPKGQPAVSQVLPDPDGGRWDRIYIGSLTERELWVEVTDRELGRTRVYHRPPGTGWGLVDSVLRRRSIRLANIGHGEP